MRVVEITVTPIASPDVSLADTKGVHPLVFLRSMIELRTLDGLNRAAKALERLDPYDLRDLLGGAVRDDTDEMLKHVPGYVRKVPRW